MWCAVFILRFVLHERSVLVYIVHPYLYLTYKEYLILYDGCSSFCNGVWCAVFSYDSYYTDAVFWYILSTRTYTLRTTSTFLRVTAVAAFATGSDVPFFLTRFVIHERSVLVYIVHPCNKVWCAVFSYDSYCTNVAFWYVSSTLATGCGVPFFSYDSCYTNVAFWCTSSTLICTSLLLHNEYLICLITVAAFALAVSFLRFALYTTYNFGVCRPPLLIPFVQRVPRLCDGRGRCWTRVICRFFVRFVLYTRT